MSELVKGGRRKRIAVSCGQDPDIIDAVARAVQEKLADVILIGDKKKTEELVKEHKIDASIFTLIDEPDPKKVCQRAVAMVRNKEADALMKGLVATDVFSKAFLNKETGLNVGTTVTHVGVFQVPNYPRLLVVSDAALVINPDPKQLIDIIENAVSVAHHLNIEKPKVALLAAVEKVNVQMPCTLVAAQISKMNDRGQIKGCVIDGPLSLDAAVSPDCAEGKGIKSPVAGYADVLIAPDIECGNILYKCLTQLAGATGAAMVMGTSAPVILTSRTDSEETKFMSIVLAALMAEERAA